MNYIISGSGQITIAHDGKSYTAGVDHPAYSKIRQAVIDEQDADEIIALFDVELAVLSYSEGLVKVREDMLFYNGEPIQNSLADRVMMMMRQDFPFKPMLKFLANILENPSNRAVQELYTFLEHKNLPITEDGCFLAYKAVREDYTDKWSGTFNNSVGLTVEMQRRKVDDNCNNGCSDGLHVGALDYVESYRNPDDKIIVVKIDPRDVVSVPTDCECQKVRCCKYQVVSDYTGELKEVVHSSEDASPWSGVRLKELMDQFVSHFNNEEDSDD